MSKLYILDRLEGNTAVLEITDETDHTHWQQIVREALPADAQEGDVLVPAAEGWQVDEQATATRRQRMAERIARLKRNGTDLSKKK